MMTNEITTQPSINPGLRPLNYKELRHLSEMIRKSEICPKEIKDKPDEVFLRIHFGLDIGLTPLQAISNVAIINGKAAIYGDAMLGVVQGSKVYEWHNLSEVGTKDQDDWGFKCTVKRKNSDPYTVIFTKKDAVKANLWNKSGPWTLYPARMLKAKAIGFALRDLFADVLKGFISKEEALDYPSSDNSQDKDVITVDGEVIDQDREIKEKSLERMTNEEELDIYDIR